MARKLISYSHRGLPVLLLLLLAAGPVCAQTIAVQGAVRSAGGGPAVDGTYVVFAAIYGTKDAKVPLWKDTFTPVKVRGGLFSIAPGSGQHKLPANLFDGKPRWIGVQLGADPELPRVAISWVPMAVFADRAAALSCTGCVTGAQIAKGAITGDRIAAGSVGAQNIAPGAVRAAHIAPGAVGAAQIAPGSIDSTRVKNGSLTAADLSKGSYPWLDVGRLGGHGAGDFVLKGQGAKAAFALNGEENVDAGVPIDVFVRKPGGEAPKKVRLDVWSLPYRHTAPPRMRIRDDTDADFAKGTHLGTKVEGAGAQAVVTTATGEGDGRDGVLKVTADRTIHTVATAVTAGTKGAKEVTVGSTAGFAKGDLVIVAQMAGTGSGTWHRTRVTAVNGPKLGLEDALPGAFTSQGGSRAQVVRVQQYKAVTVAAGRKLSATPWNGSVGGILALVSQGPITIDGTVTMSAKGFRGASQKGNGYRNQTGTQGEGSGGVNVGKTTASAGSGGGGGAGRQDSGGGGGGGHGTAGAKGPSCGGHVGGSGGIVVGNAEQTVVFMGGAGGEGGADEDGSYPGRGGYGGGIIELRGASVTVKGQILSDGEAGRPGCQHCGGSGGGMGGGGGGAGGSIRLGGDTVEVQGTVRAAGGKGAGTCSSCCTGGSGGGVGRITIAAKTVKGKATSPAARTVPPISGGGGSGIYASPVLDAGAAGARVARLSYVATALGKATWKVEIRGSDTPFAPTAAKPAWELSKYSSQPVKAAGRYLQYRLVLQSAGPDRPRFDAVELRIDRPTELGALPSGLRIAVGAKEVAAKVPDAHLAGAHVVDQLDLTAAFAAVKAAIVPLRLSSAGPGRLQWLLWFER